MPRLYADTLSYVTIFITVVLFLAGCVAPNPQVTPSAPQIIMQGDSPGKEVVQPIELNNCDGKADAKRTEHRSRSVESTISAEIAAKFGVSAEVLLAEIQATVGAAIGWTEGQGMSIELVAPPGTLMAFQLVWIGNEQVGIVQNLKGVNIPIAFRDFRPTDVRIKSQYDIGCPGFGADTPKPTLVTPTTVPQSSPISTPFATSPPTTSMREVFPFKVDNVTANTGSLPVKSGRHSIEIGSTSSYYTNPILMFDTPTPVAGWTFFYTKVTDYEGIIIVCLPVDGTISMGNGSSTGTGGRDLRQELSCR